MFIHNTLTTHQQYIKKKSSGFFIKVLSYFIKHKFNHYPPLTSPTPSIPTIVFGSTNNSFQRIFSSMYILKQPKNYFFPPSCFTQLADNTLWTLWSINYYLLYYLLFSICFLDRISLSTAELIENNKIWSAICIKIKKPPT